jgi:hypothetical protein
MSAQDPRMRFLATTWLVVTEVVVLVSLILMAALAVTQAGGSGAWSLSQTSRASLAPSTLGVWIRHGGPG